MRRLARMWSGRPMAFVMGVVAVFACRELINRTSLADLLVAPLLVDDVAGPADAIVVLGAGVVGDCEPNQSSFRRTLRAARAFRYHRGPFLLIAGGTGNTGCRVADAMGRLAVELGLDTQTVRTEGASRSTYENGVLSSAMLRAWGIGRIVLVTDRLHMARAVAVYRGLGLTVLPDSVPIYESHADNVAMLAAGVREYLALAYYRVLSRTPPSTSEEPQLQKRRVGRGNETSEGPLVLFGASYAAAWAPKEVAGLRVVNLGVAGQQTADFVERFERDVVPMSPSAVVFWGFINDIFRSPSEATPEVVARVQRNYSHLIELSRRHGIVPILATEVTARPVARSWTDRLAALLGAIRGKQSYQDRINATVMALNAWLIETANRDQLLLLDFQAVLSEPSGRRHPRYAQPDGSHITEAGYDALTTFATPVLEEYFSAR